MSDQPIYGLVCAGGGAHGAYQVGVLKYVHEHFCRDDASPFRVFAGTSAGSLNTSFYSARSFDASTSRLELEELWIGFHVPAYHGNVFVNSLENLIHALARPRLGSAWSLLDPEPLRKVVGVGFRKENFERSVREGTTLGLAVSTTELRSSRLVWFQEGPAAVPWQNASSIGMVTKLGVSHVQASCSVPLVFPPVWIDGRCYADGGVANLRPFTSAINMGATRILSLATDWPLPEDLPEYPPGFTPGIGDVMKMLGGHLSHDHAINQAKTIQVLNALWEEASPEQRASTDENSRHVLVGGDVHSQNYRPVEIKLLAPSRRIRHDAIYHPDLFDPEIGSKSTVMLFHRDFAKKLIDFGYEDGRTRHDELAEFFDPDRS